VLSLEYSFVKYQRFTFQASFSNMWQLCSEVILRWWKAHIRGVFYSLFVSYYTRVCCILVSKLPKLLHSNGKY